MIIGREGDIRREKITHLHQFLQSLLPFLFRKDIVIRIVEFYRITEIFEAFYAAGGAGPAAAVKENRRPFGDGEFLVFHGSIIPFSSVRFNSSLNISARMEIVYKICHSYNNSFIQGWIMKNRVLLAVLVGIFVTFMLPLPQALKYVIMLVFLGGYLYLKRGYLFVILASTQFNKKGDAHLQKAWRLYEKGWRAGLAPNYAHMLGNLFVQRGDPAIAMEIFDQIIERGEQGKKNYAALLNGAKISRSMALWVTGEKKEAVEALQEVKASGHVDTNLAVNLGSYLLAQERLDEMETFLQDIEDMAPQTPGMKDNRGCYLFKRGDLLKADAFYRELLETEKPKFPEAYFHAGEVRLALGKCAQACRLFEEALEHPFYHTSTVTEEEVRALLDVAQKTKESLGVENEDDEAEIHSALFDDDLFDDESPNTDLDDDDDDIDPNTDLDDADYADENDDEVIMDSEDISQFERDLYDETEEEDGDFRQP